MDGTRVAQDPYGLEVATPKLHQHGRHDLRGRQACVGLCSHLSLAWKAPAADDQVDLSAEKLAI